MRIRRVCVQGTGLAFQSAVNTCVTGPLSLLTTTNSPGIWVTTVVRTIRYQRYTDIHDLGEWWDLRGTIPMRRSRREPGTHTTHSSILSRITPSSTPVAPAPKVICSNSHSWGNPWVNAFCNKMWMKLSNGCTGRLHTLLRCTPIMLRIRYCMLLGVFWYSEYSQCSQYQWTKCCQVSAVPAVNNPEILEVQQYFTTTAAVVLNLEIPQKWENGSISVVVQDLEIKGRKSQEHVRVR